MSTHFKGPLLAHRQSFGGAGNNMLVGATDGEGDIVTVFDDFNSVWMPETFGDAAIYEPNGVNLTDVGAPLNDSLSVNGNFATGVFDSCFRIHAGDTADTGGNLQVNPVGLTVSTGFWQSIWIPESGGGVTALDNYIITFACRLGFISNATAWDGKAYIGFAEAGDVGILTAGTGVITQAETGPLVGFHIGEDGAVNGISQRTVNTAYAQGTNRTALFAASAQNGLSSTAFPKTASIAQWFDLAFRMNITDMSDNAANGRTTFYTRRPRSLTAAPGYAGRPDGDDSGPWIEHATVLLNQTPNNDVALVPTIELVNGPANLADLLVDWWTMGISRFSRGAGR